MTPSIRWTLSASKVLAAILASSAALCVATLIASMVQNYYLLPFWDEWDELRFLRRFYESRLTLADFWVPHIEHRLFLPRIFFLADQVLFGGTKFFLYASIIGIQALNWRVFVRIVARHGRMDRAGVIIVAAIGAILLFSAAQWQNFAWSFQIPFVGVYLLAIASFLALGDAARALNEWGKSAMWTRAGAAILFGAGATAMMANGVLVWPLLVALALVLRLPVRIVVLIAATGAFLIWLYFEGYHSPPGHADPIASLASPDSVLMYAAAYLGNPLQTFGLLPCMVLGGVGMAATAGVAIHQVVSREPPHEVRAALAAVLLFVVATAFVTALGRINFTTQQALSSRYVTPALIFWMALFVYGLVVRPRDRNWAWGARAVLFTIIGLLAANAAATHRDALDQFARIRFVSDQAALALALGVADPATLKEVHSRPADVLEGAEFLRAHRPSVFMIPELAFIGKSLDEAFRIRPSSECSGAFDTMEAIPGIDATRVSGWAWDTVRERPFDTILLADERIVGVAKGGALRSDVPANRPEIKSRRAGWRGLIRGVISPLAAFGVDLGARTACRIPGDPKIAR